MNFMQFFVWGAWLITIYNYWFETRKWGGVEFGAVFTTLGLSSLIMPTLAGIIADRWINAERLYAVLHILGGIILCYLTQVTEPNEFFWAILAAMLCYMPTIALSNSIAYSILKSNDFDVVRSFPPIRVWGTIGFIVAMWFVNITGNKASANQFLIAGGSAIVLGVYAFSLPKCYPSKPAGQTLSSLLGLDAFQLFKEYKMFLFFLFSLFLGASLQLTNMYGDGYISEFGNFGKYQDSLIVRYSTVIMSISQISETLFILAIPFFLKRFGIKYVMLISMIAWVFRFGLLAYGNPAEGLWMIIASCIVYGMAFDFFNVSGSLFVEGNTEPSMRSSAQGLFMMMTNGIGAILGSFLSGLLIQKFFMLKFNTTASLTTYLGVHEKSSVVRRILQGVNVQRGHFSKTIEIKDWSSIWIAFALYSLIIAILFAILFKHEHNPDSIREITH